MGGTPLVNVKMGDLYGHTSFRPHVVVVNLLTAGWPNSPVITTFLSFTNQNRYYLKILMNQA